MAGSRSLQHWVPYRRGCQIQLLQLQGSSSAASVLITDSMPRFCSPSPPLQLPSPHMVQTQSPQPGPLEGQDWPSSADISMTALTSLGARYPRGGWAKHWAWEYVNQLPHILKAAGLDPQPPRTGRQPEPHVPIQARAQEREVLEEA